jgi:hypothetical protein
MEASLQMDGIISERDEERILENAARKACEELELDYDTEVSDNLAVIVLYTKLSACFGITEDASQLMRHWLHTYNKHFSAIPSELVKDRCEEINNYLTWMIEK